MKPALGIPALAMWFFVAAAASLPMPALAAPPGGTLTTIEYQQFGRWIADDAAYGKKQNQKYAAAACRALGSSTALLQTSHSACEADLGVLEDLKWSSLGEQACSQASTTTTTTGTTTDPSVAGLTSTELQELVCLRPVFQYTIRTFSTLYAKDTAARGAGLARGLTGTCLNTVVATVRELRDEQVLDATQRRVLAADRLLTKVENGAVAPGAVNGAAIKADVQAFNDAYRKFRSDRTPAKLSSCSHQ